MLIALDKVPIFNKITENIFLGDIVAAGNLKLLKENNIEIVISLIFEKYERNEKLIYYDFPINDNREENIEILFSRIIDILDKNKEKNILIHCQNAVSRSVTILAAYLMTTGYTLKDSLLLIKKNRNTYTRPNIGFSKILLKYEISLFHKNSISLKEIREI